MNSNQATQPACIEHAPDAIRDNLADLFTRYEALCVLEQSTQLPLTHAEEASCDFAFNVPSVSPEDTHAGEHKEPAGSASDFRLSEEPSSKPPKAGESQFTLPPLPPLGPYQLQSLIGVGGHGMVFLATEANLRRRAAVKIPRLERFSHKGFRERFLREAIAIARLNHAGIISIYRFEEVGAICYIASQYVDGPNLGQWLQRQEKPCDIKLAVRLVIRLTEAVQHAHDRGVLHRDLKPGNILLEPREDSELPFTPMITDFGLAKLLQDGDNYTHTGAIGQGTPNYMSPEQASGGILTPATDVYALGMILRTLLTGVPPQGEQAPSRTREIPKQLKAIIDDCLQKEPGNRYPSAKALGDDLTRYLVGEPIVHPHRPRHRLFRTSRRSRVGVLSGLCFVALVCLVGLSLAFRPEVTVAPTRAEAGPVLKPTGLDMEKRHQFVSEVRQAFGYLKDSRFVKGRELLDSAAEHSSFGDLNGFVWRFVENFGNREERVLPGHVGDVYSARFSPDGSLLATVGKDETVRLWRMPDGQAMRPLTGHSGEVNGLAFSPDGRFIVTCGNHGRILLWEVGSAKPPRAVTGFTADEEVVGVEFSHDGRRLYAANRDGLIREWDLSTGKSTAPLQTPFSRLESLAVSPVDDTLAVTGIPPRVCLIKTGVSEKSGARALFINRELAALDEKGTIRSFIGAYFSSDGKILGAVPQGNWPENDFKLWEIATGESLTSLEGHAKQPSALAFGADPRIVATAAQDRTIRLWDVNTGNTWKTLIGHEERVWSLVFSPRGDRLVATTENGRVFLWNLTEKQAPFTTPPITRALTNFAWTADGHELKICDDRGNLFAFGKNTGTFGRVEEIGLLDRFTASELSLSPTLNSVMLNRAGEGLALFSLSSRSEQLLGKKQDSEALASRFSPDGKRIVVVNLPFRVTVIDSSSGTILSESEVEGNLGASNPRKVVQPVFSRSGRLLAIASGIGLDLWDLDVGGKWHRHRRITAPDYDRACLRFSPNDATIACGLASGGLQLIDTANLQNQVAWPAHGDSINDLAFTSDSRTLLTAAGDKKVKFWDLESKEELLTLDGYAEPVRRILFSPDEQALAVCTGTGHKPMTIQIYRLPPK